MHRLLLVILLVIFLNGCSFIQVRKMDVEQGNIVCQEMVNKLHIGMTVAQAEGILGSPMLMNTFTDHRIDYVYYFKPGYGKPCEKIVTLIFNYGKLQDIKTYWCVTPCVR